MPGSQQQWSGTLEKSPCTRKKFYMHFRLSGKPFRPRIKILPPGQLGLFMSHSIQSTKRLILPTSFTSDNHHQSFFISEQQGTKITRSNKHAWLQLFSNNQQMLMSEERTLQTTTIKELTSKFQRFQNRHKGHKFIWEWRCWWGSIAAITKYK